MDFADFEGLLIAYLKVLPLKYHEMAGNVKAVKDRVYDKWQFSHIGMSIMVIAKKHTGPVREREK